FHNEGIAEEQVANSINIDIHWEKTSDGHRYISHITEIIPRTREEEWPQDYNECLLEVLKRMARRRSFTTRDIIIYEEGQYVLKNPISERLVNKILRSIASEDFEIFKSLNMVTGG
ncbi:MAG TPA: pilus assembly protein CpaF, partial [Mobilitalea sp.]|nr:pilus assembly protein CpaF [Mobilitalea sp.]